MARNPRDWAPAPGTTAWEMEAAAYERAVERQRKERGGPGSGGGRRRRRWLLVPLGLVAALVAIGLLVGPTKDDAVSSRSATPTSGPESVSDNETHPPQADLNGDTECTLDELGSVVAKGTLTNHSSKTSSYMMQLSFNDAAGVRFAEAPVFHSDVRAGETVRWEASGLTRPVDGAWTCDVVSVERFSSQ